MSTPLLPATGATPARWTTPRLLQAARMAIVIASVLLFLAILFGVRQRRAAMQTVGKDAAPSILTAQRIKASLADMDANIANELMVGKGENSQSIKGYDDDRSVVTQGLVRVAENITYGDAERKPIQTLTYGLGTYEEQVARARALYESRNPATIAAYRQANKTLHETLFPAAEELAKTNNAMLTQTYAGVKTASSVSFVLVVFMGLVLLSALIGTQLFLSRRTQRTFNPAFLASTVLTVGFLAYTLNTFRAEANHLKVAKEDAFTSLQALWEARSLAYDANTDESRWLLDRQNGAEYETAFFDKSAKLVGFSKTEMYPRMAEVAAQGQLPPGTQGYFAQELANITFEGEKDAATETVRTYSVYIGLDKKIRALENEGNHTEAVRLCISMAPGDSNWAFSQFDTALGKTLDINQHAFDDAVEQGFADVKAVEVAALLVAALVMGLTFAGLHARLREYAV